MLDLFFRKYAWTATLALLFAAAWIAAKTVNTLAAVAIRPRPQAGLAQTSGPPPRPTLPANLDMTAVYRLIGQQPPRAPEELAEEAGPVAPQNCEDARATPSRSDLRMALVATVIADRPRFSLATISDTSTRETHVLGVGDQLGAVRLLSVERVRDDHDATGNGFRVVAVVCNAGTKEYIDSEGGSGEAPAPGPNIGTAPVPMPRPPMAGAPIPGRGMEGVRQVADNQYEIDRTTLDQTLSDLNKIATQARIVPSFENGVANGFKLFSIQPGSLYASIGIENGDVIQRVNGYEINSPEKALELYQKLRESQSVTIDLKRGGQSVSKRYTIR
ncbi:MAG TPA: type II secretion system protein GspC [Anaeromyxobacter sp.]|nr:type II secretion system protein GspC [Anaeromyxobacter sp.]